MTILNETEKIRESELRGMSSDGHGGMEANVSLIRP